MQLLLGNHIARLHVGVGVQMISPGTLLPPNDEAKRRAGAPRQKKMLYPNHRTPIPTKTSALLNHGISRAYPCSAAVRLLSEQRQTGIEHEIQD